MFSVLPVIETPISKKQAIETTLVSDRDYFDIYPPQFGYQQEMRQELMYTVPLRRCWSCKHGFDL